MTGLIDDAVMAHMQNESPVEKTESQPALLPEVQLWSRQENEKSEDKPPARETSFRN